MTYSTALIVGAGSGLSASLARLFASNGMKVALAARSTEKLAALAPRDRRAGLRLRCRAAGRGRATVRRRRGGARCAGRGRLQRELPYARPLRRSRPRRRREGDRDFGLRRLPGGAAGGAAHAAEGAGRDPADRRFGQREGLRAVGAVRDGQVRAARARAIARARAFAARHSRRAFRHRRRHPQRAPAGAMPTSPTRCSIRTRSRRAICTCCSSRAARGRRRSNCVRGWRISSAPCQIRPCRRSACSSPA